MPIYIYNGTEKQLDHVAGGTLFADLPIGTIVPFGGSSVPNGYELCDGSELLKTEYPDLYSVIGDAFGTASVNTKFVLPDLRESTIKGVGLTGLSNNHMDADGLALGEFIDDRFQGHNHNPTKGAYAPGSGSSLVAAMSGGNITDGLPQYVTTDGTNGTPRDGVTTEVKAVGVNYIIKAKQVSLPADFEDALGNIPDDKWSAIENLI